MCQEFYDFMVLDLWAELQLSFSFYLDKEVHLSFVDAVTPTSPCEEGLVQPHPR